MSTPQLTGIVAMTADRVIGKDGTLPWHLPDDLKFFKQTTLGAPILMGRKTFDSIGRPLPKRRNIVLTRDATWTHPGVDVIHSIDDMMQFHMEPKIFIIGGAEIYSLFLPLMHELIVTNVFNPHEGDTLFPEFKHFFSTPQVLVENKDFNVLSYQKK